jgi:hypothetical protein
MYRYCQGRMDAKEIPTMNVRARPFYYQPPSGWWASCSTAATGSDNGSWKIAPLKIVIVDLILRAVARNGG